VLKYRPDNEENGYRVAESEVKRCTVLVVDDEEANLETFRRVFRKEFEMTFARSGAEALAALGKQPFDVALVDYAMPEMNGVELLHRASELQPHMARLMVTAHGSVDEVREARATGLAINIIAKPWQKEQILQWVATAQRMAQMRASVLKLNAALKR
jgi:DNA-binding NtrC family response regulator